MSDPTEKINKFFKECAALHAMVEPTGFVSAQDFNRVLKVAKQYRKWVHECLDGEMIDGHIRIPRLKKQNELDSKKEAR